MNGIDLDAAAAAGIEVRNARDYSTDSVAELTFAGVLALLKQLPYYDEYVKSGEYVRTTKPFNFARTSYELHGKRWGIVGLGNIGKRVAAIATAFGCEVSYYSTSGKHNDADYPRKSLEQLLAESDVVSVHAPLSRDTYHLLGYEQFAQMKSTAVVANMARGSLIDEAGLARALNENIIAGAAIDVYSAEPMTADNPLLTVADKYKLVLTPHTAWHSFEALKMLAGKVADNIRCFLEKQGAQ
jgi:glycerate dehydrogenase